ncbi:hypothetical protein Ga0451573_000427 [Peptococcaceae bacterium DYL19]|nr:hypothetical protein [Phosphitispora fastidiosa]
MRKKYRNVSKENAYFGRINLIKHEFIYIWLSWEDAHGSAYLEQNINEAW